MICPRCKKELKGAGETKMEKYGCMGCDETSTARSWSKNGDTCPKCNKCSQGCSE
jgi:hypothetical protein